MKVMKRMVVEGDLGFERDLGVMAVRRLAALNWRFARADDRMGVREALEEAGHLHDQVGEDREVRERLDGDLGAVVVHRARARDLLAPVHQNAAGAARGVQARMAQGQRGIPVQLDPAQCVEHGGVRTHRHIELVEALIVVPAFVAIDAEAPGVDGLAGSAGRRVRG